MFKNNETHSNIFNSKGGRALNLIFTPEIEKKYNITFLQAVKTPGDKYAVALGEGTFLDGKGKEQNQLWFWVYGDAGAT